MISRLIPDFITDDVYGIDYAYLKEQGISGIVFDIDNTLVPYDVKDPTKEVFDLVFRLYGMGFKIAFVSNNNQDRVGQFNKKLGALAYSNACKPSRKSLRLACMDMQLLPGNIAFIGDQLFTDVLAGKRMGMYTVKVSPIKTVESLFFRIKRTGERPFIGMYNRRKRRGDTELK